MDLVRHILITVGDADGKVDIQSLYGGLWTKAQVDYHTLIMTEADLLDSDLNRGWHGEVLSGTLWGLTWEGQDLLDSIAGERVWYRVREKVSETVGAVSVATLKQVASQVALGAMGL